MDTSIYPVILSGGRGTRLWPLSRALYPKQLQPLVDDRSLLQDTVLRVSGRAYASPTIVCSEEHRFIVAQQAAAVAGRPLTILLEPQGRNTAPAAMLAALHVAETNPDAVLLLLPSDHVIGDESAFHDAIGSAVAAAANGYLVTLGIKPTAPETGYGYIQRSDSLSFDNGAFAIARFVEKPDLQTAQKFIGDKSYYWNSGMFAFTARRYLEEVKLHAPEIYEACAEAFQKVTRDIDFLRIDAVPFSRCPSISIDCAVMEHTGAGAVIPTDLKWSDLGSWRALYDVGEKDESGNSVSGNVVAIDTSGSYVRSDGPLVTTLGLRDAIVVATKDAVLVTSLDRAQEVGTIANSLLEANRIESQSHPRVHRPWGSYETVDLGDRFRVKRLVIAPGAKLSLQLHHHRTEHWIVVQGTARVTCGDREFSLYENESTYIASGVKHRLENPGKIALHLIEVQSGSYLEEDDIVRFEDTYGRS